MHERLYFESDPTRLIHEYGIGSLLYHDISPSIERYKGATRLIKADSFIELGQF